MQSNNCTNNYEQRTIEHNVSNVSLGLITQAVFFSAQKNNGWCDDKILGLLSSHYNQSTSLPQILEEPIQNIVDVMNEVIEIISQHKDGMKIAKRLFDRCPYTLSHSIEVACISTLIAHKSGMSKEEQVEVGLAAVLHDIGKMFIDDNILHKSANLTFHEWIKMKKHPFYGYCLIKHANYFSEDIAIAVLSHHENNIGNGYPNMLREKEISDYAQIIHIADVFDALTSKRNYRLYTWDYDRAIQYIKNNMGIMFSTKYAWVLVNIFHQ